MTDGRKTPEFKARLKALHADPEFKAKAAAPQPIASGLAAARLEKAKPSDREKIEA